MSVNFIQRNSFEIKNVRRGKKALKAKRGGNQKSNSRNRNIKVKRARNWKKALRRASLKIEIRVRSIRISSKIVNRTIKNSAAIRNWKYKVTNASNSELEQLKNAWTTIRAKLKKLNANIFIRAAEKLRNSN